MVLPTPPAPSSVIIQISLADPRCHKNICLHKEQVRDVKFSGDAGAAAAAGSYVLSTSFDRTLKVKAISLFTDGERARGGGGGPCVHVIYLLWVCVGVGNKVTCSI